MTTVREIQPGDNAVLLELCLALWPELDPAENRAGVTAMLAGTGRHTAFVAVDPNGAPIGFIEVQLRDVAEGCGTGPVGYIEGWYVAPERQRRGIGRRLVETAEDWARSKGCREMASDSLLRNTLGQQAHLALGYEEVERAVHFKKRL